jgi:hypothetical protein
VSGTAIAQQFALDDLLVRAGARIRGRGRADCPRCQRPRALSFDGSRGVYYCHGAGCDFSGGAVKLARELGLARPLCPGEREQLRRKEERADRAARALYARVHARRFELLNELRALSRLGLRAHEAGANHPATWGALALLYREWPGVAAELGVLENCSAADLIRFLSAAPELRARVLDGVLTAGGLYDSRARFVEILL